MTGSRGYQCTDGPLAGVIVMVTENTSAGTRWNVQGPDGAQHLYLFRGDHFEHCAPPVAHVHDPADDWGR